MKPSLQLRIGQSLTMTPQLQQAIRLLQLSSLDLQQEIQEALESNPLLEQNEESSIREDAERALSLNGSDSNNADSSDKDNDLDSLDALNQDGIDKEMVVDTQWEDWQYTPPSSMSGSDDEGFDFQGSTSENLQDHLFWQLDLTPLSERDKAIATVIIDAIDDEGYLRTELEDLQAQLNSDDLEELEAEAVEIDEIQVVLKFIQSFDPVGVGARNLQECLQLQLAQFDHNTPYWLEAKELIDQYFEPLASRNYKQILKSTKWPEDFLKEVVAFVQRLNPRPGSMIAEQDSEYITPDVFVKKMNDRWLVELNPDCTPKLRVNANYASLIKRADSSADNTFLKNNLQEAKWFIKSLQSRNETLLKVATSIVKKQLGFFEYGAEAMKPLVLSDIAEEVEMHESTISRVTTQKYMHTPRGVFELKYFFSSHVSTVTGGECSSTAIRALIKKLVAAENVAKPLSDSKIAALLKDQGINVARRTIAKYRESLNIPPSNERKSLL